MTDLVVCELGPQTLAFRADCVRELVRSVAITALAGAPAGIEGVIDLRGTIVPVYDLRARLHVEKRRLAPDEHFVICSTSRHVVAIRLDRVLEIRSDVELSALPEVGDPILRGCTRLPDGLVVVLDLDAALSDDAASALDDALAARS